MRTPLYLLGSIPQAPHLLSTRLHLNSTLLLRVVPLLVTTTSRHTLHTSSRAQRHNTAAKDINLITVRHHPSRPMEVLLPKAMAALLPKATAVRRVMADISRDISKLRLQTTAVDGLDIIINSLPLNRWSTNQLNPRSLVWEWGLYLLPVVPAYSEAPFLRMFSIEMTVVTVGVIEVTGEVMAVMAVETAETEVEMAETEVEMAETEVETGRTAKKFELSICREADERQTIIYSR